jgi:imidazolonepropionase-like amidohydrolase
MERWELPPAITGPNDSGIRLWSADGTLTADRVAGAERLPGNFAYPGLVDAHFHVAFGYGAVRLSRAQAHANLRAAARHGVLLVRDLGAPHDSSLSLPPEPDFPRVIVAGQHLAIAGGFAEGGHDPVPPERLVEAALAEVDRGATWVKVMTETSLDGPPAYPMATIRAMADAVHARGARVAVHTEFATARELVHAGVDSIEHGPALDEAALHEMARLGIAWTPTTNLYERDLAEIDALLARDNLAPDRRARVATIYRPHAEEAIRHVAELLPIAARVGVTLLASTDTVGTVAEDSATMAKAGVDPLTAVGSATWDARRYLNAPGLVEAAAADVVTFDNDPRADPAVLGRPRAILLNGRRIR